MSRNTHIKPALSTNLEYIKSIVTWLVSEWLLIEKAVSTSRINYYYCASFVIIVVSILLKFPALVTSAEFYAETATVFFKFGKDATVWQLITFTWADYLVSFQLLVSYILIRVFGVIDYFPGTVNFIFLLFVAFSASLINMRAFRVLISSDFLRFMIGLSIGLAPNFELYELLHANLFGFTIYLLFIFVDKNQFSRWLFYFLTVMLFLVGIARPNLVAFLPVYILLAGIAIKKRHVRDIVFYVTGIISLSLQAYVMIMAQLYWSVRKDTGIYNELSGLESIVVPLEATINHHFRTLLGVIFNQQINGFGLILTLILATTTLILLACYYMYRRKRYLILYYFGLSQILVLGLLYFIAFSSPVTIDWDMMRYDVGRWWIYSNYVMYLSLMVLGYNTAQELLSSKPVSCLTGMLPNIIPAISNNDLLTRGSVLALALLPVVFHIHPFYHSVDQFGGNESVSNWERYRHLLKDEDYYIPTNPVQYLQWGIMKDNEKLRIEVKDEGLASGVNLSATEGDLKLRSVLIVNHGLNSQMKDLIVKAYDQNGREMAIPHLLNTFDDRYLYYYFTERVRPYSLLFFNEKLEPVRIQPDMHLYGKLETGERIIISKIPD